jgi:hypothetical protein
MKRNVFEVVIRYDSQNGKVPSMLQAAWFHPDCRAVRDGKADQLQC